MVNILITQSDAQDGCTWYRLKQFAGEARRQGLAKVEWLSALLPEDEIASLFAKADAYLMRLLGPSEMILTELRTAPTHKPVILDIDDRYEDVNPFSDHYGYLGTQEVKLTDGRWMWKHLQHKESGKRHFDVEENQKRLESFKRVMRGVDAIIVTTFRLAEYARQYNDNVVVIPNCIDHELFPEVPIRRDGKTIKLLWSGGASHYEDLAEIKPVVKALMEQYPQLEYHLAGQSFKGIVKDLPERRVKTYRWASPDAHGYRLACIGADIAIAPLKDSLFNRYKSSLKFYEYGALGIPTLARGIEPYTDDIQDGVNGLLYHDTADFKTKLEQLITDPMLRATLGEQGKTYVRAKRDLREITKDWVGLFEGMVDALKGGL